MPKILETRMLSKALMTQIVAKGCIAAFEIQGINDFYRRQLEAEYNAINIPEGRDPNDMDVWFQHWGPNLKVFKQAIEIFSAQHELMVIRFVDPSILNFIQQITSAQKNLKLREVHLYNLIYPDAPPLILYPNPNTSRLEATPAVEFDAENPFKVNPAVTEESCLISIGSYIPDSENSDLMAAVALPTPLTRARSDSIATTASDAPTSASPLPSPSPPYSPREDVATRHLLSLQVRYEIAMQRCKQSLLEYKQKAQRADGFFASIILYRKIPIRFYDIDPIPGTDTAYALPLSIHAGSQDYEAQQTKETSKQLYRIKYQAYGSFLQNRNALATSLRMYKQERLDVLGEKLPKKILLKSKPFFTFKPHSVNNGDSIKRPEHDHTVTRTRKR
jgi:hypothetical protein